MLNRKIRLTCTLQNKHRKNYDFKTATFPSLNRCTPFEKDTLHSINIRNSDFL